jgi:hypothetical protein
MPDYYNTRKVFTVECRDPTQPTNPLIDPITLKFTLIIERSAAAERETKSYTYGVGNTIVRDSIGKFHAAVLLDWYGVATSVWSSEGTNEEALVPERFTVLPRPS